MTYEEKKEKLMIYRYAYCRLERRIKELERWKHLAYSTGGSVIKPYGNRCGNSDKNTIYLNLENEISTLTAEVSDLRVWLLGCISSISNPRYKEILECIYIDGMSVEAVAKRQDRSRQTISRCIKQGINQMEQHSNFFEAVVQRQEVSAIVTKL